MTTWAVWFVAAMIMFACIEGFALLTRRIPTLSATIRQLTKSAALAVRYWSRCRRNHEKLDRMRRKLTRSVRH